ncbi:rod shape-determining protein MreC [Candidatus Parcubacteria bacterium]|nr:rod shape-determining protein MreC [Patescibacteria group bacterium]MCG2686726.1 rod shape-determining protein MreC [Candidatus Parcubacteria bacterium]
MSFLKNKFISTFLIILLIIFLHATTLLLPFEKLIFISFKPFQSIAFSTGGNISLELSEMTIRKNLLEDNKKLNKKINQLEQKIVQLKLFIEENDLLINQNKYLKSVGYNFINARVISAGIENNPNLFIINRGANDNVKPGMAVVVEDGTLIGKIIKTENTISHLLLLTDNQIKISASLSGQSEISGIIEGKNNISICLNYILKTANIQPLDLIQTSGFDEYIPAGLLIGEVAEIHNDPNQLFQEAKITSPINLKNLRIVSIVIN